MIHLKNKLKGRAVKLISYRELQFYRDIKQLVNSHFEDTRAVSSLIQDLKCKKHTYRSWTNQWQK